MIKKRVKKNKIGELRGHQAPGEEKLTAEETFPIILVYAL
jgi:hypothetical protein